MAKYYERPEMNVCDYELDVMGISGEGYDVFDVEELWGKGEQ